MVGNIQISSGQKRLEDLGGGGGGGEDGDLGGGSSRFSSTDVSNDTKLLRFISSFHIEQIKQIWTQIKHTPLPPSW